MLYLPIISPGHCFIISLALHLFPINAGEMTSSNGNKCILLVKVIIHDGRIIFFPLNAPVENVVPLILYLISAHFCLFIHRKCSESPHCAKMLCLNLIGSNKFTFLFWARMIGQTSGLFPAAGAQSPAFVQKPLSQGQSSAQPVITAGFAPLSFCVGFFFLVEGGGW